MVVKGHVARLQVWSRKTMTIASCGIILTAVVFEVLGQVCLKRAAVSETASDAGGSVREFWIALARNGWTYTGIAAYVVELPLWIAALHFAPLSQAFPLLSLTYCGVALASRLLLKERISARNAAGIVLITLGAVCMVGSTI